MLFLGTLVISDIGTVFELEYSSIGALRFFSTVSRRSEPMADTILVMEWTCSEATGRWLSIHSLTSVCGCHGSCIGRGELSVSSPNSLIVGSAVQRSISYLSAWHDIARSMASCSLLHSFGLGRCQLHVFLTS